MKRLAILVVLTLMVPVVRAQQPPGEDPIAHSLFPPELVMKHGGDIGLDEKQRAAMKEAIQKAQGRFLDVQWEMQAESEKLVRLLQARPVDEPAALAQAERVMGLERDVKKAQLSLLVRIKNLLSDAQQTKLTELRRKSG